MSVSCSLAILSASWASSYISRYWNSQSAAAFPRRRPRRRPYREATGSVLARAARWLGSHHRGAPGFVAGASVVADRVTVSMSSSRWTPRSGRGGAAGDGSPAASTKPSQSFPGPPAEEAKQHGPNSPLDPACQDRRSWSGELERFQPRFITRSENPFRSSWSPLCSGGVCHFPRVNSRPPMSASRSELHQLPGVNLVGLDDGIPDRQALLIELGYRLVYLSSLEERSSA